MGAARHGRAVTAFAGALVVLLPSIAMAKTLEGTRTGSDPLPGAFSGPPETGTVAPMLVPPSTVFGSDSPSLALRTDESTEPDAKDQSSEDPDSESGQSNSAVRSSPAGSTSSSGGTQSVEFPSAAVREAGSSTIPAAAPEGAPRPAGPSIPRPRSAEADPTALALRDQANASPSVSDAPTLAAGSADPSDSNRAPSADAPSSTLLPRPARLQDGATFESCATLPSPGDSNDRIVWTNVRPAAITAGRDLRSTERVAALAGSSVIGDPSAPVEAFLLHPNTFAVMARFASSDGRSGEPVGFLDQPLPDLEIGDCGGRSATGIAPGTYLLRYAFTGRLASAGKVSPETFLSPLLPVRVIAGPTAPTDSASPEP